MTQLEPNSTPSAEALTPIEQAAYREGDVEQANSAVAVSLPPVAVFEAESPTQGEIVKGALEAEGIEAVFESLPGMTMVLGGSFNGTVYVPAEDKDRAIEIIASYQSGQDFPGEEEVTSSGDPLI